MCNRFVVISWTTSPTLPGCFKGAFASFIQAMDVATTAMMAGDENAIVYDTEDGDITNVDPGNPNENGGGLLYYLFGWDGFFVSPPPTSSLITSANSLAALQGDITIAKAGNTNVAVQQGSNNTVIQSGVSQP